MNSSQVHHNLFKLRMLVILSGILLMIGGMVMVFMDLKSEGSITIKTPLFAGSINATYIGLLVIFMGVALTAVAILRTFSHKDHLEVTRQIESPQAKKGTASLAKRTKLLLTAKTAGTEIISEQDLKKLIEEKLGIQLPESVSLADEQIRSSMEAFINGTPPVAVNRETFNKETFKFKSETSGARLASTR